MNEFNEALQNAAEVAIDATRDVGALWPDVERLLKEAQNRSRHPKTKDLYAKLSALQRQIVDHTARALDGAQRSIGIFKTAGFVPTMQDVQVALRSVDPSRIADETTQADISGALGVIERVQREFSKGIASIHLAAYDLPQSHAELMEAYLGRPTARRRLASGTVDLLVAAIGDFVPGSGTMAEALRQLRPRITEEVKSIRNQVDHLDRVLYFGDAAGRLCRSSEQIAAMVDQEGHDLQRSAEDFSDAVARLEHVL